MKERRVLSSLFFCDKYLILIRISFFCNYHLNEQLEICEEGHLVESKRLKTTKENFQWMNKLIQYTK